MTTSSGDRPLVVCEGGPMNGQWFYADEFAARQEATRRTETPFTPRAAQSCLEYRATDRTREQRVRVKVDEQAKATRAELVAQVLVWDGWRAQLKERSS